MKVKKFVLSILLTISICVSSFLGLVFPHTETLAADAKNESLQTQFVDFVMGMQYTLGDDSPVALIPLVDDLGEMMLLVRIDADRQDGGFDKNKLAGLMFKMISENSYLAMGTTSGYIVNKDNVPAFDLQPLFDVIINSIEDLIKVAPTGIEDGVPTRKCDIGNKKFASSEQQALYASDLGMEFSSTTLYYFGTADRAVAIDMRMTIAGSRETLSELHDVAKALDKNLLINRIYFDYKELDLYTQQLVGDFYFDATIDSRDCPEQIAVFACSVAYVTEDEDLKASLVSATREYLTGGGTDALKSVFGDIGLNDGLDCISAFTSTPFDQILEELGLQPEEILLQTAGELRGLVSLVNGVTDMLPQTSTTATLSRYEKSDGTYAFDIETSADGNNHVSIDLTAHLFEPSVKDLSKLTETIDYINTLDGSQYTEESWNALSDLLEQALLLNENSSQREIDMAVSNLEKAISQLVLLPPEELPPPDFTWFYILLPIVVACAGAALILLVITARKRRYADNTPMVEYDIDEDVDFGLMFGDVSGLESEDGLDAAIDTDTAESDAAIDTATAESDAPVDTESNSSDSDSTDGDDIKD